MFTVTTSRKRRTRAPFAEMSMSRDVGAVRCGPTMTLSSWRCRLRTGSRSIEPGQDRARTEGTDGWHRMEGGQPLEYDDNHVSDVTEGRNPMDCRPSR